MEPNGKKVVKVKVNDKRRTRSRAEGEPVSPVERLSELSDTTSSSGVAADVGPVSDNSPMPPEGEAGSPSGTDDGGSAAYLDDLKRLQAEFDNYRKRMMRDQATVAGRAAGRLVESLLPVLDNFERAISHGEGGEGVELVFKELKETLEKEGLEEVPAEGVVFDPNVHEAVESRATEGLEEPTCIEVYRRGYTFKGQLLRPAMVVVGRPTEVDGASPDEEAVEAN